MEWTGRGEPRIYCSTCREQVGRCATGRGIPRSPRRSGI